MFMDTEALNSTPGTRGPDSHSSYVGLVTCVGIRITVVFYIVPAQTLNQEKKIIPWNSYPLTYGTCMCMPKPSDFVGAVQESGVTQHKSIKKSMIHVGFFSSLNPLFVEVQGHHKTWFARF